MEWVDSETDSEKERKTRKKFVLLNNIVVSIRSKNVHSRDLNHDYHT
jgi:hypothetical protein